MTHDEACELVENSVKRALATLLHIKERLNRKQATLSSGEEQMVKNFDVLCNVNFYGAYLHGARKMYLALIEKKLLDIDYADDKWPSAKERKMTKKSMLECFMASTRNMEWLLHGLPQGVEMYTTYNRDKNGKVKSAKSVFKKEVVGYEEV